jgi:Zn-finger nucleic acid-binding protein
MIESREEQQVNCPVDGTALTSEHEGAIRLARCPSCKGEWFEPDQLEALELAASNPEAVAGTLEYSERPSTKKCPSCAVLMASFDFRGTPLELDICKAGHGFWLDGGEEKELRTAMADRESDLQRADRATGAWNRERLGGFHKGIGDRLRDIFTGGRL